jgi:hypothetical protein
LCNRAAKRVGLDVVREAAAPVDLDDREPLPVGGLEGLVAGDVDLAQVESELLPDAADDLDRPVAEVAAGCVVDDDLGYG